jgi:hypothetical protein
MKFLMRITEIGSNDMLVNMVSFFPQDQKKSSCNELVNSLQLQKYIFTSKGGELFNQNMRLVMRSVSLKTWEESLEKLNIKFSIQATGMIQIDAISTDEIKALDGLGVFGKQESNSLTSEMKYF